MGGSGLEKFPEGPGMPREVGRVAEARDTF